MLNNKNPYLYVPMLVINYLLTIINKSEYSKKECEMNECIFKICKALYT